MLSTQEPRLQLPRKARFDPRRVAEVGSISYSILSSHSLTSAFSPSTRSDSRPRSMAITDAESKVDNGHCLCGAIQFTITGPPIYSVVCHCENCRRQGGSTLHCASIYLKSQYTLLSGADHITTYTDTETQSGKPLHRAFCKVCGSKVSAKTPLNDQIISVPAGVLQDAGGTWTPEKEQFCADRCTWVPEFGAAVGERYVRGPRGEQVAALSSL
jgi:hypothetical protein